MQQPQQFTHIPCAADVPSDPQHAEQRYFKGLAGQQAEVYAHGKPWANLSSVELQVWRYASNDCARLSISVEHAHGKSQTSAYLKPAELRDLAQRLLDAAHDIEAHPGAVLACAQRATVNEEVAA